MPNAKRNNLGRFDKIEPSEKMAPSKHGEIGNTNKISPREKRPNASLSHTYTYFTDDQNKIHGLLKFFKEKRALWIMGYESAPTTGKKHWQGYVEFPEKIRMKGNKMMLTYGEDYKEIHWENALKDRDTNIIYTTKTFSNMWKSNFYNKPIKDPLEGKEYYDWQKEILAILTDEPDDRKIYWYWSKKGNQGKSKFLKHLKINDVYNEIASTTGAKKTNVYNAINKLGRFPRVLFVDIPRKKSIPHEIEYDLLEELKNGDYVDEKYESNFVMVEAPHIIVFANCPPERKAMSEDRWVIKQIDKDDDDGFDEEE